MQVNVLLEGSRWKAELDKYKAALTTSSRSDPVPDQDRPQPDTDVPHGFDPQDERQWQKESLRRSRTEAEATFRAASNSTSLPSTPRGGGSARKSPRSKDPADDTGQETFWSETRNMPRELSQSPAVTRLPALAPHTLHNPTSAASFALDLGSVANRDAYARGRTEGADSSARSGNSEAFSDMSGARAQVLAAGVHMQHKRVCSRTRAAHVPQFALAQMPQVSEHCHTRFMESRWRRGGGERRTTHTANPTKCDTDMSA